MWINDLTLLVSCGVCVTSSCLFSQGIYRIFFEFNWSLFMEILYWSLIVEPLWCLCCYWNHNEVKTANKYNSSKFRNHNLQTGLFTSNDPPIHWSLNSSYFSQEATSTRRVRGGWVSEDEGVVFWSVGGQGLKPPFEALPLRKLGLQKLPVRTNTERKNHENRRQQQHTRNSCTCEHTAENPSRFVTFYFLFLA